METKFISIYCFISFFFISNCISQDKDLLKLEEIKIDSTSLREARYSLKNFGKVLNEKKWTEDYEDYSRKYVEYRYDSIIVLTFINTSGKIFTNWIKVLGISHKIYINGNTFQVNDSISKLKNTYIKVYNDYVNFVSKQKNIKEIYYFGIPILIINKYNKNESYLGSFKFGVLDGVIKEIFIDLRTEGDFD